EQLLEGLCRFVLVELTGDHNLADGPAIELLVKLLYVGDCDLFEVFNLLVGRRDISGIAALVLTREMSIDFEECEGLRIALARLDCGNALAAHRLEFALGERRLA